METGQLETRRYEGFTVRELTKLQGLVTAELMVEPNVHIQMHYHRTRQKAYFILEGSCIIFVGGHYLTCSAGAAVAIPPEMIHAIDTSASGDGVRILVSFTDPGDEAVWEGEKPQLLL